LRSAFSASFGYAIGSELWQKASADRQSDRTGLIQALLQEERLSRFVLWCCLSLVGAMSSHRSSCVVFAASSAAIPELGRGRPAGLPLSSTSPQTGTALPTFRVGQSLMFPFNLDPSAIAQRQQLLDLQRRLSVIADTLDTVWR